MNGRFLIVCMLTLRPSFYLPYIYPARTLELVIPIVKPLADAFGRSCKIVAWIAPAVTPGYKYRIAVRAASGITVSTAKYF